MSTNELESKVRELRQLQALIAEAEAEAETTWKHVTSTRMDTAAIKAALPEVAARFTRTTTTRRFCVA